MMARYPDDDTEFQDRVIAEVSRDAAGTYTIVCEGWHMWCGKDCTAIPLVGQTARFYGRGIGYSVRGLFINGEKAWYRTNAEDDEHHEIECYGKDAPALLARWDEGRPCWTIEMGGMGPGYEQCIQVTAFEILRWLLNAKPTTYDLQNEAKWPELRERIFKEVCSISFIHDLGLSGAQCGAAQSLGTSWYINGPRETMKKVDNNRHIQASKNFPRAA